MHDFDVTLRLEVRRTDEPVEDRALRVLEVIERHGSHIALGPVVGGTLDPPAVELDFDVVAASSADAYERVAEVIGIIERYAGLGEIRSASLVEGELVGS